jgi:hypothetical protein
MSQELPSNEKDRAASQAVATIAFVPNLNARTKAPTEKREKGFKTESKSRFRDLRSEQSQRRFSDDLSPEPGIALNLARFLRARVGHLTFGLSPPGLLLVYLDRLTHAAMSAGKQYDLVRKMWRKAPELS